MSNQKTGDPRDGEQHDGRARFAFSGPTTGAFVPGPVTSGLPQPEPEERWTLAPICRTESASRAHDEPATEGVPVVPVHPSVTRAAGGGEQDRA